MTHSKIKYFLALSFSCTLMLPAEVDLMKGVYSSAEEMIKFDEKMNKLIAEHNGVAYEKDQTIIQDFEETKEGYLLERSIDDSNNTKVDITVNNRLLTISTTKETKEKTVTENGSSYQTTTSQSSTSLYLPHDADEKTLQESLKDGNLTITFKKIHKP